MNERDSVRYIREHLEVPPQLVAQAKAYALQHPERETQHMVQGFLRAMDAVEVREVRVDLAPAPDPSLDAYCHYAVCTMAITEAIWSLIHAGIFVPATLDQPYRIALPVMWRSARGTGPLGPFPEVGAALPERVQFGSALRDAAHTAPSAADLFVHDLDIPDLHPLVEESLHEAVRCFRMELYTPCLVMLARALQGAWTELGLALASATRRRHPEPAAALAERLASGEAPLRELLLMVRDYYDDPALCAEVRRVSEVREDAIRQAWVWSEQVRDPRTVLDSSAQPPLPNTYERVSALLMGAVPYLRDLYAVRRAALQVAEGADDAS